MEESGANGQFVVFDCNLSSDDLFESSLFGYVKGSFTGADKDKKGIIYNSMMIRIKTSSNQSSHMSHINKQIGTHLISNGTKTLPIHHTRIG